MFRMLCKSARNLSTRMYILADDLGLIDIESIYSKEMNRFCGKMCCIRDLVPMPMGNVRKPPVDIVETDEAIIVTLELPGVDKEAIEITATDDELSIYAKRAAVLGVDESAQDCERSHDIFRRNIRLPCGIKREQAKAALNKGLLTITVPKENAIIRNAISIE